MVKLRFLCFSFLILVALNSTSQSLTRTVISVTGISTISNNGLLSYSAGELITGCLNDPENCLTQGFQQPSMMYFFEENIKKGINAVEVYPNPVIKDLTILFNARTINLLHIDLYSYEGTLIRSEKNEISETGWIDIEMGNLHSGIYLLHIYSIDKVLDQVFKIEKM